MSLSAQIFGRDSSIFKFNNIMLGGGPGLIDSAYRKLFPEAKTPSPTIPTVQDSAYGNPIPRFYGTIGVAGNVIWLKGGKLDVTVKKKKSGGKGGSSSSATTTYSYFATFALSLGEGPIAGIRRMWCGDKLIYNAGSDDLETIVASNQKAKGWKLYRGTDDQLPDPDIQADKGVENTPAYRGLAYIKFKKFALKDYGDSLAGSQFKIELMTDFSSSDPLLSDYSPQSDIQQTLFKEGSSLSSVITYVGASSSSAWDVYEHYLGKKLYLGTITRGSYAGNSIRRFVGNANTALARSDNSGFLIGSREFLTSKFGSGWQQYDIIANSDLTQVYVLSRNNLGNRKLISIRLGTEYEAAQTNIKSIAMEGGVIYGISDSSIYRYNADDLSLLGSVSFTPATALPASDATYISCYEGLIYLFPYLDQNAPVANVLQVIDPLTGATVNTVPNFPGAFYASSMGAPSAIYDSVIFQSAISGTTPGIRFLTYGTLQPVKPTLASIISRECALSSLIGPSDIDVSLLTQQVTGLRISGGSVRDNIEPLRAAWPFDVRMHGFKLQFLPRGQSSQGNIPWTDLAATDGDDIGDSLPYDREMDTQLPAKVTAKGISANREYADSSQTYERLGTSAVNAESIDLGLVLSDDELSQIAEKICELRWMERQSFSISLPPTYQFIEPGDVRTITAKFGVFDIRFTEVSTGANGILDCKGVLNNAALYTSNAVGASSPPPSETISLAGPSLMVPLDIPMLDESLQNAPGFVGVMCGYTDGWPGGVMVRSPDNGQTWSEVQAFVGPGSIGRARNTLPSSACILIDQRSITVDFLAGEPESITRDQMLAGANYAAYGADGRWEIVRFQNAALQADGSYLISGFVRGEKGTEWASGLHQGADWFILLDDPDNAFIGMPTETIGAARTYRAVTSGASIDDATDVPFTYKGVNLECLSPVYAGGTRDGSSNFSGTFTRRSRFGNTWWANGIPAVVGETSESYEIDVMQGTTVKRTIAVTSPSFSYSAANQVIDFGSAQAAITFRIFQISNIIGRGYPLEVTL